MSIVDALRGRQVYVDANVFIYFLHASTPAFDSAAAVMQAASEGAFALVTGDAVVSEVMVAPYRSGSAEVIQQVRSFFANRRLMDVVSHTGADFDAASQLRARQGAGLIDSLHVSTAHRLGCSVLLTNDRRMPQLEGVRILQLT